MSFELEKIATDVERIAESMSEGGGGSGGSDGGILFATIDGTTMTFDKTWKQIHDASFVAVFMTSVGGDPPYPKLFTFVLDASTGASGGKLVYLVRLFNPDNVEDPMRFTTDSEDGYPSLQSEDSDQGLPSEDDLPTQQSD